MTSIREPERIAVVGGGRWARVTLGVLHDVLPLATILTIHSSRNADAMQAWASDRFGQRPFAVTHELPEFDKPSRSALIVVNAARDHEAAAVRGLVAGVPVLVEKPLALTGAAVKRLIDLAMVRGAPLAAGHVLRFARYLQNYAAAVTSAGTLAALQVRWKDARAEARYGEVKSYDSSIPVFVDCLPHVFSLIAALVPVDRILYGKTQTRRGGAEVAIHVQVNDIPVDIVLARNAMQRQRWVEATLHDGGKVALDFQKEPGVIHSSEGTMVGDTLWSTAQRPLAAMLSAFLAGVRGNDLDSRLSPTLALRVSELVDQIHSDYVEQLLNWARAVVCNPQPSSNEDDLDYALRELLQVHMRMPEEELKHRIQVCLNSRSLVFN